MIFKGRPDFSPAFFMLSFSELHLSGGEGPTWQVQLKTMLTQQFWKTPI